MLAETEISIETTSLTGWQWVLREADPRLALTLAQKFDLPEVLARVLAGRGVGMEEAEAFLNPSLKVSMPDPSHLLDMDKAAGRVAAAIVAGEKIAIFGDYDVDGATSSALLARYFRALGAQPMLYIPDRMTEGYGPNAKALLGLQAAGASLVITVDCGTMAFEALEASHKAGLDVIVIDHHIGEARKPAAYAIVNPNRLDESSPHRQVAAVGVAFLLAAAVNRTLREQGFFANRAEPDLKQLLDLVALGTVCDVVPLTGVNRALVAQGLKIMAGRGNTGIRTLLDLTEISEKPGTYHAGFVLGPRINAGGRVGKSDLGVRLLATDDPAEALSLAKELDVHNAERKAIEAGVLEQAMAQAEKAVVEGTGPLLIVSASGWHPGVIGIVAGRLKERFHMPTAVIAITYGVGKASARSVSGFDMGAAVIAARDEGLLLAGGGHAMAAGFSVEESKITALAEFLNKRAASRASEFIRPRRLMIDADLNLGGATLELVELLERLGPFGQGNPSVKVVLRNVINLKPEPVGENHIRTLLIDRLSNAKLSAIAFRAAGGKLGQALVSTRGQAVDVAVQLRLNEWMGKRSVSVVIEDIATI
jgi:single-stranded-DNA-specific exonuclease